MGQNKIDIPVVINNKVYTLSGYEGEDYLQNVATYINGKIAECKTSEEYRRMNAEYQGVLLALNIDDDYFKALNNFNFMYESAKEKYTKYVDVSHYTVKKSKMKEEKIHTTLSELQILG